MDVLLIALAVIVLGCGWVKAKMFFTQPQALQAAFPSTQTVERKTAFLTTDQIQRIEQLARTKMDSSIVTYYVAHSSAGVSGVAFFDRRLVRSMPVTYMAVVKPDGSIDGVEILSFDEPDDYLPPENWLRLYKNHKLTNGLMIGHDIPHITGASLSSQAMNDGIRLQLAIYAVAVQDSLTKQGTAS